MELYPTFLILMNKFLSILVLLLCVLVMIQLIPECILHLELEHLSRDLDIQKGIFLTLKQQMELANIEKIQNFAKYVPRQNLTTFLTRYEIFKKILDVPGSIIECGVLFGGGLMTFAQLSAIFEHVNFERQIIGFDTFSGFPNFSPIDKKHAGKLATKGAYGIDSFNDLKECIKLYDSNRFLEHLPKVQLVKGDASKTIPKYVKDNPSTVVSLLYLDFLLYKPTKIALETFVPRMPKGSLLVLNMINEKV